MKGTLITTKEPVFKQRNKISKIPPYPMFLKELTVIDSLKMDYLELPVKEAS